MGMVEHFQSPQNITFTMSLQYLQKQVRDKVAFLYADKHPSFLQVYFKTLGVKVLYKLILSVFFCMIKHSQSTEIDKFAINWDKESAEARVEEIQTKGIIN